MNQIIAACTVAFAAVSATAPENARPPIPLAATSPTPPVGSIPCATDCRGPAAKPQLTVWTSAACFSCRRFWRDFHQDPEFRTALLSRFYVHWIDADEHRILAGEAGIQRLPSFDLGERRIAGYVDRHELWRRLVSPGPDDRDPGASDSEENGPPAASPSRSNGPPAPLAPLSRKRQSSVDESIAPGTELPKRPPQIAPSRSLAADPRRPQQAQPVGEPLRSRLWQWAERSTPLVLTGLEVVGLLAGSATTGGVGSIAITALWRAWRRHGRCRRGRFVAPTARHQRSPDGEEEDASPPRAPFPRRLDEARELLALRQSEGRVATLDALRGMFLDDELSKLDSSPNEAEAAVAAKLKSAIDSRVDEVAPLSTTID